VSLKLDTDVHVPRAITVALRLRGVEIITAQEDFTSELPDPDLLDKATSLNATLFTQDEDFLIETARRMTAGVAFAGVIYGHQRRVTIGQAVADLELVAKVYEPSDIANRVEYLPLR
jgi:hypothetical protein